MAHCIQPQRLVEHVHPCWRHQMETFSEILAFCVGSSIDKCKLLTGCGLLSLSGNPDLGHHLVELMAWCLMAPIHYLKHCWRCAPGNNFTRSAYDLDSLRPCSTTWQHKSGSTLAQVMPCCLTAPSHYRRQCWIFISNIMWRSIESNFKAGALVTIQ